MLIHERMAQGPDDQDWPDFATRNPDMLIWKGGPFFDYYDEDVLRSDTARKTFVLPQRRPVSHSV